MSVREISTEELQKLILNKAGYFLIDIRERNELLYGVIPTSKNIPLSELVFSEKLSESDFEKKHGFSKFTKKDMIILYCRTGSRSTQACEYLDSLGYNVLNYKGSILEWSKIDKSVKAY